MHGVYKFLVLPGYHARRLIGNMTDMLSSLMDFHPYKVLIFNIQKRTIAFEVLLHYRSKRNKSYEGVRFTMCDFDNGTTW